MKTYIYVVFVLVLYALSFILLWSNSQWETTVFCTAVVLTVIGFWIHARGWELFFEWLDGSHEP